MKRLIFSALLGPLLIGAAGAAHAQCKYAMMSSLPIKYEGLKPTIDSKINGQPATLLIDTGSDRSNILRQSAERLGLKLTPVTAHAYGFNGESKLDKTLLDEITLGPWTFRKQTVLVTEDLKLRQDMLLGANFLFRNDLELSLQNQELKMFKADNCDGAFLAYWDANAQDVPLEKTPLGDPRAVVTVELNGKKFRALLDSGMQRSAVNLAAAAKLGITPESDGVIELGKINGVGQREVKWWLAKFQSFAIGGETISNPKIAIIDMYGAAKNDSITTGDVIFDNEEPDMILGADFLRAHHVLFAMSQRRFYFSYLGGKIFDISDGGKAPAAGSEGVPH